MRASTIPNLVSALRLAAAPWIGWAILAGRYWTAVVILVLAGITDGLDGFLARRLRAQSRAGAYLDPVADKVLVVTLYLCLGSRGDLPWWLVLLVFSRDLLILTAAALLRNRLGIRDFPPSRLGKLATTVHIVTLVTVMVAGATRAGWVESLASILIWLAAAATISSGVDYAVRGVRLARRPTRPPRSLIDGARPRR